MKLDQLFFWLQVNELNLIRKISWRTFGGFPFELLNKKSGVSLRSLIIVQSGSDVHSCLERKRLKAGHKSILPVIENCPAESGKVGKTLRNFTHFD